MLIEQLFIGNSLRNFNYLIACPKTGDALLIDPFDAKRCLARAAELNLNITQVINTHEHWDHVGGNAEIVAATQATIMAHFQAIDSIPHATRGLHAGDIIKVGSTINIEVLDTPGHTMAHVCLLAHSGDEKALFSGDTLFNAGCGNCYNGGDVHAMFHTVAGQLARLPDDTKLYPGHEYLQNNLRFSLFHEPTNQRAQNLLDSITWDETNPFVSTLGLEKEISPFFRLANPEIVHRLTADYPELSATPSSEDVFVRLRQLRDKW